jgi:hypothetical protein
MVSWMSIIYFLIGEYLFDPDLFRLQKAIPGLLLVATILMVAVILWTLRLSNRYFGAYERIIKDFDDILAGAKSGPLETRKGDVIFEGLLKRINALIQNK